MIQFCGKEYSSPIMAASGTLGWGLEAHKGGYLAGKDLAAICLKGLSLETRVGAPQPRVFEMNSGVALVNAIGLENPGADYFLDKMLSQYQNFPKSLWLNLLGSKQEDYSLLSKKLSEALDKSSWAKKIFMGFELNLSCPNVDAGGLEFGTEAKVLESLVSEVKKTTLLPIMVKLGPASSQNIEDLARAAVSAGATALSLGNTLSVSSMGTNGPELGRAQGGLSGPPLRPVNLRLVERVSKLNLNLDICGVGGIQTKDDLKMYLNAGAKVVQIGTGHLANPWISEEILSS